MLRVRRTGGELQFKRELDSRLTSSTTETAIVDNPAEGAEDGRGHHTHAH